MPPMLLLLPPSDRAPEVALRHPRAALDAESAGAVVQLLLRRLLDVDAAEGLSLAAPFLRRRLLRPRVARTGLVVRHPAVAPLLVRVLEDGQRRPMRALALAVLLDGGVMCLRECPLRLPSRPLQSVRELGAPDLLSPCHLRHGLPPQGTSSGSRMPGSRKTPTRASRLTSC